MFTLVVVIHLIASLFLIFIVLIQSGKGAEMGAAFGGSTQTLFGSRGAATFLSKLTTAAAILFMLTSLSLTIVSAKSGSVIKDQQPSKTSPAKPSGTTGGPIQETAPAQQSPAQGIPAQPAK
ncbi:MAG: preprotein translocase subunit SecG [Nitrospirae bacterium]|nr:preprotein translocase subunit SecG [Nitrospirota bacterium]